MVILFAGIYLIPSYEKNRRRITAWRKFARRNNLFDSIPGNSLKKANIAGNYKGYRIKLDIIMEKNNQTDTRLIISEASPINRPSKEDIIGSLSILEGIVRFLTPELSFPLKGEIAITDNGAQICYQQQGTEYDTEYLQFLFDLLHNLIASYPVIISLGGKAVTPLKRITEINTTLKPIALHLLHDIGQDTTAKFWYQSSKIICPQCLVRFAKHQIKLSSNKSIEYYGCRICKQSREFLDVEKHMIATLDKNMTAEYAQRNDNLHINWLNRRALNFEFDEVEIVKATDEDVERFAVQIGNDTINQPRYKQMECMVSSECELSDNTMRILQHLFGQVVRN